MEEENVRENFPNDKRTWRKSKTCFANILSKKHKQQHNIIPDEKDAGWEGGLATYPAIYDTISVCLKASWEDVEALCLIRACFATS